MQEYGINIRLNIPGLVDALNRIADSNFARAGVEPPALTPAALPEPPEAAPEKTAEAPSVGISFNEVHTALVDLKNRKDAKAVRAILDSFGCKTVQDIPKENYAEALRLAREG